MLPFNGGVLILWESPVCVGLFELQEKDKAVVSFNTLNIPRSLGEHVGLQ